MDSLILTFCVFYFIVIFSKLCSIEYDLRNIKRDIVELKILVINYENYKKNEMENISSFKNDETYI